MYLKLTLVLFFLSCGISLGYEKPNYLLTFGQVFQAINLATGNTSTLIPFDADTTIESVLSYDPTTSIVVLMVDNVLNGTYTINYDLKNGETSLTDALFVNISFTTMYNFQPGIYNPQKNIAYTLGITSLSDLTGLMAWDFENGIMHIENFDFPANENSLPVFTYNTDEDFIIAVLINPVTNHQVLAGIPTTGNKFLSHVGITGLPKNFIAFVELVYYYGDKLTYGIYQSTGGYGIVAIDSTGSSKVVYNLKTKLISNLMSVSYAGDYIVFVTPKDDETNLVYTFFNLATHAEENSLVAPNQFGKKQQFVFYLIESNTTMNLFN